MRDRPLTPTAIAAWLECNHTLTLRRTRVEPTNAGIGGFARMLLDKGLQHEHAYLERLRDEGRDVMEVPLRGERETFGSWEERVRPLLLQGHEVLAQMPFVHDGLKGIADFLLRVDGPSRLGDHQYEPVDAKLARTEAKPGHVLQLCFYADALAAAQGSLPEYVHLYLGSTAVERIRLANVHAYWRRVREQLSRNIESSLPADTIARPCAHCAFCEYQDRCNDEWRQADALHFVAGLTARDTARFEAAGITTLTQLADRALAEVEGVRPERFATLHEQARLQVAARTQLAVEPVAAPPVEVLPRDRLADPHDGYRSSLPAPDDADVFLDLEGHPIWSPGRGLFFLFGLLRRGLDGGVLGGWSYEARWAHEPRAEAECVTELVEWLTARRAVHPGMHVYHYNHTERSALVRLAVEHGVAEEALGSLVEAGVFVDLLDVVRRTVRVGAESYGLKIVERVAGFLRESTGVDRGAGAVLEYEAWMGDRLEDRLATIATYNEADVAATRAVRDWLLGGPLAGAGFRPPSDVGEEPEVPALPDAALIAGLLDSGEPWQHLLAHLLGYWRREWRTFITQRLALLDGEPTERLGHDEVIAGLELVGERPPVGRQREPRTVFRFPPQELTAAIGEAKTVAFRGDDGTVTLGSVDNLDVALGELVLVGAHARPHAVVTVDHVSAQPKPAALQAFAQRVVQGITDPTDDARVALLRGDPPRFSVDGPADGTFTSDVAELARLATRLDGSVLAVQGPPGTGKTYAGARMILALIDAGCTVGVTSFSHAAIDNLLRELIKEDGDLGRLRILRSGSAPPDPARRLPGAIYGGSGGGVVREWAKGTFNVVGGTSWTFANAAWTGSEPLDVLLIDEAGQLGLADALVAMGTARSTVLLGDPLQLAQVSQASHPDGSGASALEHVLAGVDTLPPERGAFLDVTRRMHPAITSFLSDTIYDGRLTSAAGCGRQSVDGEAGVRWLRARHVDRSTYAPEEAEMVADLVRDLVGRTWRDAEENERAVTAADVMVVAAYNGQVDLVRAVLDADPVTAPARVGTVDRFQGQEAPVVIFTMATSTGADIRRGIDFLFSRNRLNVAVSRARALAFLICTEELLNTRARDVETMFLIGTLCAFVEEARRTTLGDASPPRMDALPPA
jgi:predicted RecB family nuclease